MANGKTLWNDCAYTIRKAPDQLHNRTDEADMRCSPADRDTELYIPRSTKSFPCHRCCCSLARFASNRERATRSRKVTIEQRVWASSLRAPSNYYALWRCLSRCLSTVIHATALNRYFEKSPKISVAIDTEILQSRRVLWDPISNYVSDRNRQKILNKNSKRKINPKH